MAMPPMCFLNVTSNNPYREEKRQTQEKMRYDLGDDTYKAINKDPTVEEVRNLAKELLKPLKQIFDRVTNYVG